MRKLDEECKQALLAPFQASEIRIRTTPYVACYVTARVVMTRLDEVLAFQWSFRLGSSYTDAQGNLHQDATLTLHNPEGPDLVFEDRGSAPPDLAKGAPKQAKAAVSDAFKRCAVQAGVGRVLYEIGQGAVTAQSVSMAGVEKALAAVGYKGPTDARHWGQIGGIREADAEDDEPIPFHSFAERVARTQGAEAGGPPPAVSGPATGGTAPPPQKAVEGAQKARRGKAAPAEGVVSQPAVQGALEEMSDAAHPHPTQAAKAPLDLLSRTQLIERFSAAATVAFGLNGSQNSSAVHEMKEHMREEFSDYRGDQSIVKQLGDRELREMIAVLEAGKIRMDKETTEARREYRDTRERAEQIGLTTHEITGGCTPGLLRDWTKSLRQSLKLRVEADNAAGTGGGSDEDDHAE